MIFNTSGITNQSILFSSYPDLKVNSGLQVPASLLSPYPKKLFSFLLKLLIIIKVSQIIKYFQIINMLKGAITYSFDNVKFNVNSVAFSKDGQYFSFGGTDKNVSIFAI